MVRYFGVARDSQGAANPTAIIRLHPGTDTSKYSDGQGNDDTTEANSRFTGDGNGGFYKDITVSGIYTITVNGTVQVEATGIHLIGDDNISESKLSTTYFQKVGGVFVIKDDSIEKTKIAADVAGLGLAQASGGELDVQVDGSTIEIDATTNKLKVKDNTYTAPGHAHVEADITDLDKYTQSEIDVLLDAKADVSHTHADISSLRGNTIHTPFSSAGTNDGDTAPTLGGLTDMWQTSSTGYVNVFHLKYTKQYGDEYLNLTYRTLPVTSPDFCQGRVKLMAGQGDVVVEGTNAISDNGVTETIGIDLSTYNVGDVMDIYVHIKKVSGDGNFGVERTVLLFATPYKAADIVGTGA